MPVGYLVTVLLLGWGVLAALTCWPALRPIVAVPALLANELPFMAGYLLAASTGLALAEGDLDRRPGQAVAVLALAVAVGVVVLVRRALRAHTALATDAPPRRAWAGILLAPFPSRRRGLVRTASLRYGSAARHILDVTCRQDRPAGSAVLLHVHGGGFRSGNKAREARPLFRHLAGEHAAVCVSAEYRLQPHVTLDEQVADVRAAIGWVREHCVEYGGDPGRLYVTGSSAGAYLLIRAVNDGERGLAGLIGRYGYYGDLTPRGDVPPLLVVHGDHDLVVPVAAARAFVARARSASSRPVTYAELPGGHHDFDLFESIRAAAVGAAVADFIRGPR